MKLCSVNQKSFTLLSPVRCLLPSAGGIMQQLHITDTRGCSRQLPGSFLLIPSRIFGTAATLLAELSPASHGSPWNV